MTSIMEDFSAINARLEEIKQERDIAIADAPVEEAKPETSNSWMGIQYTVYPDSGDTAPCEYVCWTPSGPIMKSGDQEALAATVGQMRIYRDWSDFKI